MDDRELKQQMFIRVCRDSGFQMDAPKAAVIAASVLGSHPLLIWCAFSDLNVMSEIAAGKHPAAHRKHQPKGPDDDR